MKLSSAAFRPAIQRIKRNPSGIILIHGGSSTGRTFAADVLARKFRRRLFRVDLSQIVGKYIGETEKNLANVFDRATQSDAILYFDEADAIFGKRTDVRDSHDRYANEEISYLLAHTLSSIEPPVILAFSGNHELPVTLQERVVLTVEADEDKDEDDPDADRSRLRRR